MTLTKREKVECGWVEKEASKSSSFSKAVNACKNEFVRITLTSPSPKSEETNIYQAQSFENDLKQFGAIELARHNTYR